MGKTHTMNINTSLVGWRCRRGMLELDEILLPFFEKNYASLNENEQILFAQLLDEADPDLCAWLLYGHLPENAQFSALIEKIKAA